MSFSLKLCIFTLENFGRKQKDFSKTSVLGVYVLFYIVFKHFILDAALLSKLLKCLWFIFFPRTKGKLRAAIKDGNKLSPLLFSSMSLLDLVQEGY